MMYVIYLALFFFGFLLAMISIDLGNIHRALERIAREIKEKKL